MRECKYFLQELSYLLIVNIILVDIKYLSAPANCFDFDEKNKELSWNGYKFYFNIFVCGQQSNVFINVQSK